MERPVKRLPGGTGVATPATAEPPETDPWERWTEAAVRGLASAAGKAGLPLTAEEVRDRLVAESGSGVDLAFPVHRLAATVGRPAEAVGRILAEGFPATPGFAPAVAAGAYVNLSVEPGELVGRTVALALASGPRYGHGRPRTESVCVEHTSANPTGPFHIGRVRNAIIGDTLVRVLRAAGFPVTSQYYVDDMGRQAAMITWIWSRPRAEWPEPIRAAVDGEPAADEKPDRHFGRPYPATSRYLKENPEAAAEVADLGQRIEEGHPPPEHRAIARQILDGMLASLGRLGISFDEFVWESEFLHNGAVDAVLGRLRSAPHAVREENGAWAIDASGYGLPKESTRIIFQRGNGTSLYVTRDVAYHLAKFDRFRSLVDVLGQDHQLHARTLEALLQEIAEPRRPAFLIYQDVTVPEGGRMATRKGSAVWLDGLLEEAVARARAEVLVRRDDLPEGEVDRVAEAVATGAIRFHVVRVAPEKPVQFRWEDALSFEGRSGPFVQYAYARASSVLRKGEAISPPYPFDAAQIGHPEEVALARVLSRLPGVVTYTARTRHVHRIAGYAHDLADQFNRFYHAVPVLRSGAERGSRIALVAAVRQGLANSLDLLGLSPLEAM
jgi:arginyl-tRNA synthetase